MLFDPFPGGPLKTGRVKARHGELYAECGRVVDHANHLEHRLEADRAVLEGVAAERVERVDDDGLDTKLGRPQRRGKAAGAAADYDQVYFACELADDHGRKSTAEPGRSLLVTLRLVSRRGFV